MSVDYKAIVQIFYQLYAKTISADIECSFGIEISSGSVISKLYEIVSHGCCIKHRFKEIIPTLESREVDMCSLVRQTVPHCLVTQFAYLGLAAVRTATLA